MSDVQVTASVNKHMTHIEDLVLLGGERGGRWAISTADYLLKKLKGDTPESEMTLSVKVDGAPAAFAWSSFPGLQGPGVSTKGLFAKSPKIANSREQIDELFGNSGELPRKLKSLLDYVPHINIPAGEIWQGDFLFDKQSLQSATIDGEDVHVFHPNTIVYTVPKSGDLGELINHADVGIVWHTRYRGDSLANIKAEFNTRVSELRQLPGIFMVDPYLDSVAGSVTLTDDETSDAERLLDKAVDDFTELTTSFTSEYQKICGNEELTALFTTYQNSFIREGKNVDPKFFVKGWSQWIQARFEKDLNTKKTEKGKQAVLDKLANIMQYLEDERYVQTLFHIISFIGTMTALKAIFIKKLNALGAFRTHLKMTSGEFRTTNQEGFAVSDIHGNVVKLVDRSEFSFSNFSPDVVKGWLKESLREDMSPTQMDKFLAKNSLQATKQTNKRDGRVSLEVRSTAGIDRDEAASRVAMKLHIQVIKIGDRPVIEDPSLDPYSLQFKPTPGVGSKTGEATVRTTQQEVATAYALYSLNELNEEVTLKKLQKFFPDCDQQWLHSIQESARAYTKWMKGRKGYVYSRGDISFPEEEGETVHELIKQMSKAVGFKSADSWNPSDIYICKQSMLSKVHLEFEKIENARMSTDGKLDMANEYLEKALNTKTIIGVSLKKVKKDAKVEKHEIDQTPLLLEFLSFPMALDLVSVSALLKDKNGSGDYMLNIRSNSSEVKNVAVEFKKRGASAQMGKATGSPEVAASFAKYKLHKPDVADRKEWVTLSPGVIADFAKKAVSIKRNLPGVRFTPADVKEYLEQVKTGDDSDLRTFQNVFQILTYGYLFSCAARDGALNELVTSWLLAAKKNTETSAPFVKITDF